MFEDALAFASAWHYGVKDKNGEPYILHPLRIALAAQSMGLDEETQAVGLLHDVVEDKNVLGQNITLAELSEAFPGGRWDRVIRGVDAMTRRYEYPYHETYMQFVSRVSQNVDARKVKMLDNADNMRPERGFHGMKLAIRYERALRFLNTACIVSGDGEFLTKFRRYVTWVK